MWCGTQLWLNEVMPGIVQNVADNLFEIGKSTAKGTVGAVTDIATSSIEQIITSTPGQVGSHAKDKQTGSDKQKSLEQKKSEERRRLEEVKAELARYSQRKQELDRKIAEDNAIEKNEKDKKIFEKNKKDSFTQALLKKLSVGSHGETDKQKE